MLFRRRSCFRTKTSLEKKSVGTEVFKIIRRTKVRLLFVFGLKTTQKICTERKVLNSSCTDYSEIKENKKGWKEK